LRFVTQILDVVCWVLGAMLSIVMSTIVTSEQADALIAQGML
jgi:hypothetical protein